MGGHYGVRQVETDVGDVGAPRTPVTLPAQGDKDSCLTALSYGFQVMTHTKPGHTPGAQHTRSEQRLSRALTPTTTILFLEP